MKKALAFGLASLASLIPLSVFAVELTNPLGYNSLYEFLTAILDLVAFIAFPVLVLFVIFLGFRFVQSGGSPDKLKEIRSQFFWALVGGLLVLGGKALSLAIQATVEDLSR